MKVLRFMSKEIWLGPVLGKNRERLLERCREYLAHNQTDRLLYLAASHPLLDLVTDKLLDGKNAAGVWGEFPVYLFRGFVRRILSSATAGLLPRTPIDREELPLRRSLISQIIKQLSASRQLQAIKPLANRDGCVNTISTLIGELQRAGKTPEEFRQVVEAREHDSQSQTSNSSESKDRSPKPKDQRPRSQLDFDREVALIYAKYSEALDKKRLTDEDADQLRALQILRRDLSDELASRTWLKDIELLVLDGFFDFTPVQGEILRCLIPQIPNVIVNLNHDPHNEEIFRPFQSTVDHLKSIASFETIMNEDSVPVSEALTPLRRKLFNVDGSGSTESEPQARMPAIQLLECADRELEIRSIAKEIKRLVLTGDYRLADIALVVRERAAYADAIVRVFQDEAIPLNLERRVEANDVPAVRACGKLLQLLKDAREHVRNPKATDLAHLIKTGYFRPSDQNLEELTKFFDSRYATLLEESTAREPADSNDKLRRRLGIGRWRPDDLENVIAYVGSELRIDGWVDRAHKLIKVFPTAEDAQTLVAGNDAEDTAAVAEDEVPPEDGAVMDRRKRPAPIHPAAIAWSILVLQHLQQLLSAVPEEGAVEDLRSALMLLLNQLQFSNQVNLPFGRTSGAYDVPQATVDVRGRESLRRAIAAAVRSFSYASEVVTPESDREPSLTAGPLTRIPLASFIDEVERCLSSQTLALGAANRDGLRVLEATDVRGLSFRAIFIAGMIEGGFPLRTSRDWLYPHEERVRLQKHGIFLEDISTDTLLKEEHYFYQAACRATGLLYLTRPLALNDGTETVASYYVEELRRAIAPAEIKVRQIRGDIDDRDLSTASTAVELGTNLIRQSQLRSRHRATLSPAAVSDLLTQAERRGFLSPSAVARINIEHERNSEWFGPYDGEITNADLRAMLARHFGDDHVYSASRLSTFGNCAYRFFGNRVLRIEPRSEAALDLQAIDAGKLLHDILRCFFEKHRGEYLPAHDLAALRRDLAATADQVFKQHEDKVPPLNERIWKIDCEIRKLILDQVLLYELRLQERTSARGMSPAYFELAFGRASQASDPNSTKDFLKLTRPGSADTALVQGQIDRVDLNKKEGIAVAYDYKLSEGSKLDDLRSGRQVQIPIYLAALEQLFVPGFDLVGGGYYTLRGKGPRLNRGLYRLAFADCTSVTSRHTKLSDDDWQRFRVDVAKRVWEFIDGMRGGHFRVKPSLGRHTCKFCDYSAVCRYDAYRINRKRTESVPPA